jgi:hypothetical protein
MGQVTMTHPDLPEQPIEVDEVSVPHHQAAGWQVVHALPPQQLKSPARSRRQNRREDES